jgi:hypothetical protein
MQLLHAAWAEDGPPTHLVRLYTSFSVVCQWFGSVACLMVAAESAKVGQGKKTKPTACAPCDWRVRGHFKALPWHCNLGIALGGP